MKFLYKIYSNYDGFTPAHIPDRMLDGRYLRLGWTQYLDAVDRGAECWIYFHGRHAFTAGVYVKGFISDIDRINGNVTLRVRQFDTDQRLTDAETHGRIASAVATRYRQVFLWPDEWDLVPDCDQRACQHRLCNNCPNWQAIPLLAQSQYCSPTGVLARAIVPAYWIIPTRCYVYREHKTLTQMTKTITHMFGEFKVGEERYAYPLALGIYGALRAVGILDFDAIIPIPLSPDKKAAREVHRTKLLAQELSLLLGTRVREYLSLTDAVSKRRMLAAGYSLREFRHRYTQCLSVSEEVTRCRHVLLIDDVITYGATISCASQRLVELNPDLDVVVGTAGQMIVKPAVNNEDGFVQM